MGCFIGVNEGTDEAWIGTETGEAVKARSVNRFPGTLQKDPELLLKLHGVPWRKDPELLLKLRGVPWRP
eukprot:3805241-Prorocentrum_lima.AAC.1